MKNWIFTGIISVGIAAGLAMAATTSGLAHGGATGIVKERMELMKSLGDAMKKMQAMLQNKAPYNASEIRKAANSIKKLGGEELTKLFPEGSMQMPTEAMPGIWKNWDHFKSLADNLILYAGTLDAAAENKMGPGHMKGGPMMMGKGPMTGKSPMMGGGGPMMMGGNGPDPEALKSMPAMASFMRLSQTCTACHTDYRKKKDK